MRSLYMLILLLILAAAVPLTVKSGDFEEQDLLIFYSNDVIGETDPCG